MTTPISLSDLPEAYRLLEAENVRLRAELAAEREAVRLLGEEARFFREVISTQMDIQVLTDQARFRGTSKRIPLAATNANPIASAAIAARRGDAT